MISIELKQLVDPNNEACCEYHLAHKVKEWAYSQEEPYELISGCLYAPFSNKQYICEITNEDITLYADTEPEAIFKAAEWILNQQDKGI